MRHEYFWMSGMWMPPIVGLLIIISILYLIFGRKHYYANNDVSALEILKKRYVQGDISKEEFQEMKKELE